MAKFKVGDKVKIVRSVSCGIEDRHPEYLIITEVLEDNNRAIYHYDGYNIDGKKIGNCSYCLKDENLELYKKINNNLMENIKKIYKNLTRTEPEKSAVKAGIITDDGSLTSDGKELFLEYLYEGTKVDFDTKVVQPILKEIVSKKDNN